MAAEQTLIFTVMPRAVTLDGPTLPVSEAANLTGPTLAASATARFVVYLSLWNRREENAG